MRKQKGIHIRSLAVLAAAPHDDVRRTRLRPQVLLVHVVAADGFLEQAQRCRRHTADVAARVRGHDAEEALAGFFGEIGLLEETLRGVDVGEVEGGAGVARVEDGGQSHTGL